MDTINAIFLDRDGTLNEDQGYVHSFEEYQLLPGVIEGLKLLKDHYIFIIITNQPGIGMDLYTWADFALFHGRLISDLRENEIEIKKTYVCPHTPEENCACRKPSTVNIDKCVKEYNINLDLSWVIGDHPSDIQLGINAGCRTVYLCTSHGKQHFEELKEKDIDPTYLYHDFFSAARKIHKNRDFK